MIPKTPMSSLDYNIPLLGYPILVYHDAPATETLVADASPGTTIDSFAITPEQDSLALIIAKSRISTAQDAKRRGSIEIRNGASVLDTSHGACDHNSAVPTLYDTLTCIAWATLTADTAYTFYFAGYGSVASNVLALDNAWVVFLIRT